MSIRNNHVFKGHKTLLGTRYVTYGELELPTRYGMFPKSNDGFDWGYTGSAPTQLAFSMLCQLSNEKFAKEHATQYANEVIKNLINRDWIINASDVLKWIVNNSNTNEIKEEYKEIQTKEKVQLPSIKKTKKQKTNIVKEICKTLKITQKNLAEILEVPEGTVSSWAVKNELPRLGKKAIEFYMLNAKNQKIIDSYKNFATLLHSA